jgi:predicted dehydrogenase
MSAPGERPRLGFAGLGWIGRHRLEAVVRAGVADVVALADPSEEAREQARVLVPSAVLLSSFDALLTLGLDGVVIATPSAAHAEQCIRAFHRGFAVFCQKPLGRTHLETERVVAAARESDRLLAVDFSYRRTRALEKVRALVASGGIGRVFAGELVFHNGYGPDKPWFYDPSLSGGGCLMDLGVHLVDAALFVLGFPRVLAVTSRLFARGRPLVGRDVEDYVRARLDLEGDVTLDLACSWRLPVGRDAVIAARFYGTEGGAVFENVDGSFYDFAAEHHTGTSRSVLESPPDSWGGRAVVDFATRLAESRRFAPESASVLDVARVLDRIYGRADVPLETGPSTFETAVPVERRTASTGAP